MMNHAAKPSVSTKPDRSVAGMAKILAKAKSVVANSTSAEAADFDVEAWLARWIERPQPSLGGKKPAEFLDTSDDTDKICRLLGAMESGSYL